MAQREDDSRQQQQQGSTGQRSEGQVSGHRQADLPGDHGGQQGGKAGPGGAGQRRQEGGESQPGQVSPDGDTMFVCTAIPSAATKEQEAVVMSPWPRNERGALAGAKSVSYAENVVALTHARRAGGGEAIFANTQGDLCEGSATNVFLVRDGLLHTPPLSSGCLAGVTRELTLEVCRAHGIPISEKSLPATALAGAEEAFLTSSMREVQAIASVDGTPLSKTVGPLTRRVAGLFREFVSSNADP